MRLMETFAIRELHLESWLVVIYCFSQVSRIRRETDMSGCSQIIYIQLRRIYTNVYIIKY